MFDKHAVFEMLSFFDIQKNDVVAVHTSLKAIGPLKNGAEGLLCALREYLSEGLVVVPTHTWAYVSQKYYDPQKTKSCLGVFPNVAAFHPDAVRSLHPTHSVAVFGKRAAEYVDKEKNFTTPQPPDSCLSRLCEENGKVLLMGVGLEKCTYIHGVEEILGIPNRLSQNTIPMTIKAHNGSEISTLLHYYCVEGLGNTAVSDFYPNFEKPLADFGALKYGSLGAAKVLCCDAKQTYDVLKMLWSKAEYDLCCGKREIPTEYYQ